MEFNSEVFTATVQINYLSNIIIVLVNLYTVTLLLKKQYNYFRRV